MVYLTTRDGQREGKPARSRANRSSSARLGLAMIEAMTTIDVTTTIEIGRHQRCTISALIPAHHSRAIPFPSSSPMPDVTQSPCGCRTRYARNQIGIPCFHVKRSSSSSMRRRDLRAAKVFDGRACELGDSLNSVRGSSGAGRLPLASATPDGLRRSSMASDVIKRHATTSDDTEMLVTRSVRSTRLQSVLQNV